MAWPERTVPTGISAEPRTRFRIVKFFGDHSGRLQTMWQVERELAPNVWLPVGAEQMSESDAYMHLDWHVTKWQCREVVAIRSAYYG